MNHYLIAGSGTVGKAWGNALEAWGHQVSYFDPAQDELPDLQTGYPGPPLAGAFICVPTPTLVDYSSGESSQNLGHVMQALELVSTWNLPWIAIRSTITPGATEHLEQITDTPLIAHPEFLRQRNAEEEAANPKLIVLGNIVERDHSNHMNRVLDVYPQEVLDGATKFFTSFREAFLYKYAANLLFSTKVVFANTILDMQNNLEGPPHHALQEALQAIDELFAGRHMNPFQGEKRGFGGHCLPKDAKLWQGEGHELIDTVVEVNEQLRGEEND